MSAFLGSMLISSLGGSQSVICTDGVFKYVMNDQNPESLISKITYWTELQEKDPKSVEYDNDAHTAYLQVLVSLLTSINGLGAKPEDINKPVTALMRKNMQSKAFENLKDPRIDTFLTFIVEKGT